MPGLTLGDTIPNVEADSTVGHLKLYDYVGDNWAIIFSHPGMVVLPSSIQRSDYISFHYLKC